MPRIARITDANYPHHIVQRGNNKEIIFFDDSDRRLYMKLLRKYSMECNCTINAYCIMNNHVHLLLKPLRQAALSKMMQKLSLRYTQCINKKYERTGRLWECRFYSSLIEEDAHLWTVCRYIERNPVRAKIVVDPMKYVWSSAGGRYSEERNDALAEPIWYNNYERKDYIEFLNAPETESEITNIRNATHKGMPIGSKVFIEQVTKRLGIELPLRPKGRPRKGKWDVSPF